MNCKGIRTIIPEENCPPIRVRVWVRVRVRNRVGGAFFLEDNCLRSNCKFTIHKAAPKNNPRTHSPQHNKKVALTTAAISTPLHL